MKILFVLASAEYLRYYDGTLALLAKRGHEVTVAVNHDRAGKKFVTLDRLPETVRSVGVLPAAADRWRRVAKGLRGTQDFIRYLDPRFAHATALRQRIKRKVLPPFLHDLDGMAAMSGPVRRAALAGLALLEEGIPTVPALDALLRSLAPDAVVVTPLVDAASEQVDVVKSARRLRIPVAAGIASWDNLTNKGLLRVTPDQVIVWNRAQALEAVELHGVPGDRMVVTGAQLFDRWFERRPARSADAFAARIGLSAAAPFLVFVGSSGFISEGGAEIAFVRTWLQALRASSDPRIRTMQVLVRPHPYNARQWAETVLAEDGVSLWPRGPYDPVEPANRDDFFDTLYYASGVVGINTSALIEAAIVGRPVFSILTPEFAGTQEGTLHFHHLLPEHGGFLQVAASLEQHVDQLAAVLGQPEETARRLQSFVDTFVRPHGRNRPATPLVVDAIERLRERRAIRPRRAASWLMRPVAAVIARVAAAKAASTPKKPRRRPELQATGLGRER